MFIFVVIVHVFVSLAIIGLVLLQAGKGADIGSAFGGGGSQAVFGSMGTPTVLGKLTGAVAILFLITSFSLAMLSSRTASTIVTDPAPAAAPAASPAPAAAPAPAASPAPAPGQR
jgi:preprotein translocase subunit SecG